MMNQKKHFIFIIAIIAIIVDQVSKVIIRANLHLNESIPIIPGIFNITYTENTGAAFSMLSGQVQILTIVSIVATIIIIAFCLLDKNKFSLIQLFAWGLLLGGTNGNLIDRLFRSSVTDFIDFTIINFPVFNFADIFIDVGAFIIIVHSIFFLKDDKSKQQSN